MTDSIPIECSHCGKSLKLKSRKRIGSKVTCPKCGQPFVARESTDDESDDDLVAGVSSYDEGHDAIESEDDSNDEMPSIPGGRSRRKSQENSPRKIREAKLRTKKGLLASSGFVQFVRSIIAGFIGGALGAVIWVVAVNLSGSELGYIAWIVGILTGAGIRVLGNYSGTVVGWMAAVIAMICVLVGKLAAAALVIDQRLDHVPPEKIVIATVANEIANQKEIAGDHVPLPRTVDVIEFDVQAIFPNDIWEQAQTESADLSDDQRSAKESGFAKLEWKDWLIHTAIMGAFIASFGLFDVLWMLFAAASAFGITIADFGT